MARRVFFSFHYERDIWRASIVRNSWVAKPDREAAGFWDAAEWEKVRSQSDAAIKRWINKQMKGTSVTAVLIGSSTYTRKWVKYEIGRSYDVGNGILGVYIHRLKNRTGRTSRKGRNPLDRWFVRDNGGKTYFSQIYWTYDWIADSGDRNFGRWVERAAREANR